MNAFWFILAVSFAAGLGLSSLALLRRRGAKPQREAEWDWADDFSIARYRPMERLLAYEDQAFLRSQPGYHPSLEKSLRKDRRRVFRSYLKSLRRDFHRLYFAAKQCALYSESDQSALLQVLIRQRATFYYALGLVEFRLALHTLGAGTTIDVRQLVSALEALRDSARILQPAMAAA